MLVGGAVRCVTIYPEQCEYGNMADNVPYCKCRIGINGIGIRRVVNATSAHGHGVVIPGVAKTSVSVLPILHQILLYLKCKEA